MISGIGRARWVVFTSLVLGGCSLDASRVSPPAVSLLPAAQEIRADHYADARELPLKLLRRVCYERDDIACEFKRIDHAEFLQNGGVILADQTSVVRAFDERGRLVRTYGRRGAGPGEMQVIGGVSANADGNISVLDVAGFRLIRFASDGSHLSTSARPLAIGTIDVRFANNGYAALSIAAADSIGERVPGRIVGRHSETDSTVLAEFQTGAQVRRGTSSVAILPPFTPELQWAFDGDSTVVLSDSQDFQFAIFHANRLVTLVRSDQTAVEVSAGDRDSAKDARRNPGGRRSIAPGYNESVEKLLAKMPRTRPAITALAIDAKHSIWVRSAVQQSLDTLGRRSSRWDVFDVRGVRRGFVRLPASSRILRIRSDTILVAETEAIGREFVALYRLNASRPDQ